MAAHKTSERRDATLCSTKTVVQTLAVITLLTWQTHCLWTGSLWFFGARPLLWLAALWLSIAFVVALQPPLPRNKPVLLLRALLAVPVWCFLVTPLPNYILDAGMRRRVASAGGEAKLQAWAEEMLNTPPDRLPVSQHYGDTYTPLRDDAMPSFVRAVPMGPAPAHEFACIMKDANGRYLDLYFWNRRPQRWGILFREPDVHPEEMPDRWVHRWRPGMYGWQMIERGPG